MKTVREGKFGALLFVGFCMKTSKNSSAKIKCMVYVYNMLYPEKSNETLYPKQCPDTWETVP